MATFNELNEKALKLRQELDCLKNHRFSKFLTWKINKKEDELKNINKEREDFLSEESFLNKLQQDKIRVYLPSCFDLFLSEKTIFTCSAMRISMTEHWGFLVPGIRFLDKEDLKEDEFEIELRGGIKNDFIKIDKNISENDISNFIVAKIQTYLFDNAEILFSNWDMYKYVKAVFNNEEDIYSEFTNTKSGAEFFAYFFMFLIPELLTERYCIKNINYIADTIYKMWSIEDKSKDKILKFLKENLKKYPEEIFYSDWAV